MTTVIICSTVVICLVFILKWATDMSKAELPMFTYGECVKKESDCAPSGEKIGFAPPEESSEKKSDKAVKDAIMADPITMTAALLRGEVDIDELSI